MGKQVTKKAAEMAVKKSGGKRMKAPSLAKKSEKKKAENSSSADLRQPKDRDSIQERVDLLLPDLKKLYDVGLLTSNIFELAVDYSQRHEMGNELFQAWHDDYLLCWNQNFDRFDAPFNDHFGSYTCEQKVDQIFQELDNSWDQVFCFLITCFDIDNVEKHKDEYMWSVCCLGMRVAQQEPFAFFDINQAGSPDNLPNSTYWSHEVLGNPCLTHEFSMVAFWMMCLMIFDHPWARTYNSNRGTADEYLITSREVCNIRDQAYGLLLQAQKSQVPIFKAPEPKPRTGEKFFIQDLDLGNKELAPPQVAANDQGGSSPPSADQVITIDDGEDDEDDEDVEIVDEEEEDRAESTEGIGKDDDGSEAEHNTGIAKEDKDDDEGWEWKKLEKEVVMATSPESVGQELSPGLPEIPDQAAAQAAPSTQSGSKVNTHPEAAARASFAKARTTSRASFAAPAIQTEVVTTNMEDKAISEMTGATSLEKDQEMAATPARSVADKNSATLPAMDVNSPPKFKQMAHLSIPSPTKLASRTAPIFNLSTKKMSKKPTTSTKKVAKTKRKMTIEERLTSFCQMNNL